MKFPRVLLAAPKSGSGKTLTTCALLKAIKNSGRNVVSVKCGPDYIDPMFHRTVQQIQAENLDTFFSGEEGTLKLFMQGSKDADITVMEGVMGLFDGLGGVKEEGSAYHLAKVTKTPVILLVDVHGMGRSMIPLIKGFLDYDSEKLIKGIILNRMTASFFETMKPAIEAEIDIPVIGYMPTMKNVQLESRHLGLMMPSEIDGLKEQLQTAANQLCESVGLEKILDIANAACELDFCNESVENAKDSGLTLAVARDEAFCFYYGANIRAFENKGVKIKYFSPIHDKELPEGTDALLFGGGYPELYAKQLSENTHMLKAVKDAIDNNIPSLAECGGFMYLHDSMEDTEGNAYNMVGAIKGNVSYKGKLVRFGYVEVSEKKPNFLPEGKTIKAHEFHYFDSTDNGEACKALKPVTGRSWDCVKEGKEYFWGFPHLYYASAPEFVDNFVEVMIKQKYIRAAREMDGRICGIE